jgi:REP element-mobilizing transposase RayT
MLRNCTAECRYPAVALLDEQRCTNSQMTNSYRVFTDKHYAYFVTWTVIDWLPLFAEPRYRQIVLDSLGYLRTNMHTQLNAFVVMSSHVHAVLWPDDGINLSDITRDFKRFTSRKISREAEQQDAIQLISSFKNARGENRAQKISTYQVWQEGSHPEAIFTEKFAKQKIDYIHLNPVRAGIVKTAEEWIYSSARAYLLGEETDPATDLLFVG